MPSFLRPEKPTRIFVILACLSALGLLGPNGAGKTTSISMMCGLLKPDSGQVMIHGKPITNGDMAIRTHVGVCPQNIVLWSQLTCLEQMQFIGDSK